MKGIIYIPYANGSCTKGFRYDKPLSAQQYVKMQTKEYDDHKDGVDNMMVSRYGMNMSINHYDKRKMIYKQQNYIFHQCECMVLNMNGQQENFANINEHINKQDLFILILNLNEKILRQDPDLETDLKMWFNESQKVKNCGKLSDVEVMHHLPKKDFKLKIEECSNMILLKDCKFLKFMGSSYNAFAIIINKAQMIKE